jgi:hypothetical protein
MAESKMKQGIRTALESINNGGTYEIIEGSLYNGEKKLGSLDKASGNIYYVIKGVDILASRLHYAYHNGGVERLKEGHGIHFLDDNRLNLNGDNLVQLPRKGYKQALTKLRTGMCSPLPFKLEQPLETYKVPTEEVKPTDTPQYTEKELQARAIMQALNAGKTVKEVAEQFNVPSHRVRDVRNGKSNGKATVDAKHTATLNAKICGTLNGVVYVAFKRT